MISKRLNLIVTGIFVAIIAAGLVSAAVTIIWTGDKSVKIDTAGTVTTDLSELTLLKGTNRTVTYVITNSNAHMVNYSLVLTVSGGTGVYANVTESGSNVWSGAVGASSSLTLHIDYRATLSATPSTVHLQLSQVT